MLSRGRPKLLALSLLALTAGAAHAQLSGAIWTSTSTGTTVNGNLYSDKTLVYLNGGAQNTQGATALPEGIYFFQVTTPSGALLLSSDNADQRIVHVNSTGHFDYECKLDGTPTTTAHKLGTPGPNGGVPVQLYPFNDTTNNGGEYKAWLMLYRKASDPAGTPPYSHIDPNNPRVVVFLNRYAKTDNFKIKPPKKPPQGILSGTKWFDENNDGHFQLSEPGIGQFLIKIILNGNQTVYAITNPDGTWQYPNDGSTLPGGTTYKVSEVLPPDAEYGANNISNPCPDWIQTAPGTMNDPTDDRGYSGVINGNVFHLDFGNTQAITVSGDKFYDKNMNGTQDAGEPSIANWPLSVTVTMPGEKPVTTSIFTDVNGNYSIPNLVVGASYSVSEIQGGGTWLQTGPAGNNYNGNVSAGNGPFTVAFCMNDVAGQNFGNIQQGRLTGRKFYDSNADGKEESGEPGIQNFKIEIDYILPGQTTPKTDFEITDAQGKWTSILLPDGTSYVVKEVLPPTGNWHQSFPSPGGTYSGTITGPGVTITPGYTIPPVTGLDFGNYVPVSINAKTKGFWHNQNGYAAMNDGGTIVPELQMLNALCLVRLDGSPADFDTNNPSAGFTDFSNWITNDSNGSNMACQLSAQLAAMELNVEAGYVSGDQLIFAPGASSSNSLGIAKLSDLMAEANSWICANPITVVSSAARTHQTALEQALDSGNNNLNWVGTPIIIVSPY